MFPVDNLNSHPLQVYFDGRVQLYDIIAGVLEQTGPAKLTITTFSTSEEFLRRMYRLRSRGLITHARLITDFKAAQKTAMLYQFMSEVFDAVFLALNHSKVVLVDGASARVSIVTSQNQTRGNRTEAGVITTDSSVYETLSKKIETLIDNSANLNELRSEDIT